MTKTYDVKINRKVRLLKTSSLRPYPNNPRKHSDEQINQLVMSISNYGLNQPPVIDENRTILVGHGRVEATKRMGLKLIPCIVVRGLTKAQKKAFVLADNKIAELSKWDNPALKIQFKELDDLHYNLELTGFSSAECDKLIFEEVPTPSIDPEDLTEEDLNITPVSRLGDLWKLGENHYLLCGSCLDENGFQVLLGRKLAQMIFTDPPYNVHIDGHARGKGKSKHREFVMASGEMSDLEFIKFLHTYMSHTHKYSVDGSIHYHCMDWRHLSHLFQAAEKVYGTIKQLIVWNKDNGGMGTFYRNKHEMICVYKKGSSPHINNFKLGETGRYRTNVWDYQGVNTMKQGRGEELAMHPTVKPVTLVADAIRDCSKRGGIILDPFCGSGTTIIAAERTGRKAYCIELDPLYVDVAIQRYRRVTGKDVILVKNGKSYDEIADKRMRKKEMR